MRATFRTGSTRTTEFFLICLSHDTLENHYRTTFAMHRYHKYTVTDLMTMLPWERQIIVHQVMDALEQEKESAESGGNNLFG